MLQQPDFLVSWEKHRKAMKKCCPRKERKLLRAHGEIAEDQRDFAGATILILRNDAKCARSQPTVPTWTSGSMLLPRMALPFPKPECTRNMCFARSEQNATLGPKRRPAFRSGPADLLKHQSRWQMSAPAEKFRCCSCRKVHESEELQEAPKLRATTIPSSRRPSAPRCWHAGSSWNALFSNSEPEPRKL